MITLIAALAAVSWSSYKRLHYTQAKIASTQARANKLRSDTQVAEIHVSNATARQDYFAEVATVHEETMASFPKLSKRYGVVEPKHGKVSIRRVPAMKESKHQSPTHFRISVPEQFPVYLRSAVHRGPDADGSGMIRRQLDTQDWLAVPPFNDASKSQIRLAPGIHDLVYKTNRSTTESGNETMEVVLDGKLLAKIILQNVSQSFASSSSISGHTQYDFDFANGTQYLTRIDIDDANHAAWRYWIWLSAEEDVEGFQGYQPSRSEVSND